MPRRSANVRRSRTDHCSARVTLSRGQVADNSRGVIEQERHHRAPRNPQEGLERHHHRLERSHQGSQHHHQMVEHYSKRWEGYQHQETQILFHQGSHLLLRPGSHLLLWLGSHRMCRITRPPLRDPTQVVGRPSTARTPRERRGQTPSSRPWISPASTETHFGPTRRILGAQSLHQSTKMPSAPRSNITRG